MHPPALDLGTKDLILCIGRCLGCPVTSHLLLSDTSTSLCRIRCAVMGNSAEKTTFPLYVLALDWRTALEVRASPVFHPA